MIIPVQAPTFEKVVIKTEAEMRALGYKNYQGDKTTTVYFNRPQVIRVRVVGKTIDLEAMCLAQTGMTPSDYQAKFNQAWNA